jgi:rRNA maturation endonuclease Nob1
VKGSEQMKSIILRCKECKNVFGILSDKEIEESSCPHCGSTDVDYPTEEQEDRVMEYMNL